MLIRNRLTLNFTILATSIQVVLSILVWYFYSLYRKAEFYERLEDTAIVAGRLLISRRHLHDDFFRSMVRTDLLTIVDEQISIWDNKQQPVFTNRNLTNPEFFRQKISLFKNNEPIHFQLGRLEGTGISYSEGGQDFYIFCAGFDTLGRSQLDNLSIILPLMNLLGFSLIVIAGWNFSKKALSPIITIISEVEDISYKHLHKRVNEGNRKDEIAQLAITFNEMLLRLEDAFTARQSFVAHASHELRTPLTNILGTLETSLHYDTSAEDLKASMAQSISEINKLIGLTNGLLSLASVADANLELETVQADDCLLTAIAQIKVKYPDRKITFSVPTEYDTEFIIEGSNVLLTTALANILDNACKYSEATVNVQLSFNTEEIHIKIIDSGIGIPATAVASIYEPLVRGNNTAGIQGFGIGLAITNRVIALHKGRLEVQSEIGKGTEVTVVIPRSVALVKEF